MARTSPPLIVMLAVTLPSLTGCRASPDSGPCESRADPSALSDGFQVPRIPLKHRDDGTFALDPMDSIVYATCASFRCPPCFSQPGESPVEAELRAPRREIANFDACVVGYVHLVAEQPQFSLDELQEVPDDATCEHPELTTGQLDGPRNTAQWLGCWIYGPTGIIEATELLTLSPDLVDDCSAIPTREPPDGGTACRLADEQGVGVCIDGACEAVCSGTG